MKIFEWLIVSVLFYQFAMIRAYKRVIKDKDVIINFKNGEIDLLKHNLNTVSKKYYDEVNSK